ncbi:hypothetical protein UK23_30075 [Lentzea aerocolonigenes]|uniref:DUF4232 domain-containing protein n=1 Tax=Lentzea aerocolonigenes TaxID=68170 RepID=A0A0F0GL89_LENAE|nr:DUF4232 domain-containing protein [Lentzea aerocolonigenes]KJK44279.1 hypothetical protein UK23_30075 [Lentzea aerocolonigenes]
MRVTILAAVLVAGLAACGPSAQTPAAQSQSPSPTSTAPTSGSDKQKPAVDVKLTMQGKPGLGLLAATNQGKAPITFQGWPKLAFTNPANQPAAIPVEQKLVPGEGPSITLQPGQTAFAGVQFDVDDANSFAINEMTAELPGLVPAKVQFIGTDGQPIADLGKLKVSEAKVGTLQPVTQGVLVFD